jgi:hypothetical protein
MKHISSPDKKFKFFAENEEVVFILNTIVAVDPEP